MQSGDDQKADDQGRPEPAEVREIELKVANTTPVQVLATAIAKNIEEGKKVLLRCIGVQAVSQCQKAVAAANSKLAPQGSYLATVPFFSVEKIERDGTPCEITVMKFRVIRRQVGE